MTHQLARKERRKRTSVHRRSPYGLMDVKGGVLRGGEEKRGNTAGRRGKVRVRDWEGIRVGAVAEECARSADSLS